MTITEQWRDFTAGDHLELIVEGKAKDQRIRDLEREVERLKPFEAKAERWFAEIEQREADRADAARFRYLTEGKLDFVRSAIDDAMAKDPQL